MSEFSNGSKQVVSSVAPASSNIDSDGGGGHKGDLTFKDLEEMLRAVIGPIHGTCSDGEEYGSLEELWGTQVLKDPDNHHFKVGGVSNETLWYTKAYRYWEDEHNCPITDDGVLGGFSAITPMDSRDSHLFIDSLIEKIPQLVSEASTAVNTSSSNGDDRNKTESTSSHSSNGENEKDTERSPQLDLPLPLHRRLIGRAADCGAGIGRVAKHVLLHRCEHVDLVEQSPRLLAAAPSYLLTNKLVGSSPLYRDYTVDDFSSINVGLQNFSPAAGTYDLIWVQWVVGHLHDLDMIRFLRRCAVGLKPHGVVVLKDNVLLPEPGSEQHAAFAWDREDSSVARHVDYLKLLVTLAGLRVIQQQQQTDFPENLYPVMMMTISL